MLGYCGLLDLAKGLSFDIQGRGDVLALYVVESWN